MIWGKIEYLHKWKQQNKQYMRQCDTDAPVSGNIVLEKLHPGNK